MRDGASIATATKAGIRVRMIASDHAVTAATTARQPGIDGTVITGADKWHHGSCGAGSRDLTLDGL